MKNSIKLTALLVLASVSVFAASPVTLNDGGASSANVVTFSSLPSLKGLEVKITSEKAAKAAVIIYDEDRNVVFKDIIPAYQSMEKGYILTHLQTGDYSMEVTVNHQTVKKDIYVYVQDGAKTFIVKQ